MTANPKAPDRKPLAVGDRCRVYEGARIKDAEVLPMRQNAPSFPGAVLVRFDEPTEGTGLALVHEKQCRRLRKKEKPQQAQMPIVRYFHPVDHPQQTAVCFKDYKNGMKPYVRLVECPECGGKGKVVVRLEPSFDVRKMEIHPKEVLGECECVARAALSPGAEKEGE